MRLVVFGETARLGALVDGGVADLAATIDRFAGRPGASAAWIPPGGGVLDFIQAGPAAVEVAGEALARAGERGDPPLRHQRLHAPWPGRRMICGGANHPVHMSRALTIMGAPVTPEGYAARMRAEGPRGFFKPVVTPAGPDDTIHMPGDDILFDYEGELAVVMARAVKNLEPETYRQSIFGVALICDWGVRDMCWPPGFDPFNASKVFDDCLSLGPCILIDDGLDPDAQQVVTRVNGVVRQDFNTAEFALSFGETLAGITRTLTLLPGDLVSAGSGPGTAMDTAQRTTDGAWRRDLFLKPGDVVEVSNPSIGALVSEIAPYSRLTVPPPGNRPGG